MMVGKIKIAHLEKDINDFKKATGDKPSKVLIRKKVRQDMCLSEGDKFEGAKIVENNHINKDWILV